MKGKIAIILAIGLAAALLCACAQPKGQSADMAAMQQQLDRQAAELAALQEELAQAQQAPPPAQPAASTSTVASGAAPTAVSNVDTLPPPAATETQTPPADYGLPGLTERVEAMVAQMETATEQTLFDALFEAKALENEIDAQDDAVERDYRQNLISRDDYRSIERELELLEERLNQAEDSMEYRLGYDD